MSDPRKNLEMSVFNRLLKSIKSRVGRGSINPVSVRLKESVKWTAEFELDNVVIFAGLDVKIP